MPAPLPVWFLTTEAAVTEIPEKESPMPPMVILEWAAWAE
jgi:hypothetical protein